MKKEKDINLELANVMKGLKEFILKEGIESYIIIGIKDFRNFYYAYDFKENPSTVLSVTECVLHDMKNGICDKYNENHLENEEFCSNLSYDKNKLQ